MKSTKTILAVAIVIAGFAYAVGAGHPQYDSLKHSHCGPHPEDLRSYYLESVSPTFFVEGVNGMVITDVVLKSSSSSASTCVLRLVGEPNQPLLGFKVDGSIGDFMESVQFQSGIPVPTGAEISGGASGCSFTVVGYVY